MKRPDRTESALHTLHEMRVEPERFDWKRDLPPFLRHRSNLVVAKAAALALPELVPDLVKSFRRLIQDGAKLDPGCAALTAIAKKLVEIEDPSAEVFFLGIRHKQNEPVWGGHQDCAAGLRGLCAIGLVRMGHPDALFEAVALLIDPEPDARIGAIRALAESGKPEAELLLRYKALLGDEKPEAPGECFAALLRLGPPSRALPFVAGFLSHGSEDIAEAAAVALGESRMTAALPLLHDGFARAASFPVKSAVLLGLALLRQEAATEFLFDRVENDRERVAAAAIQALALHRNDETLRQRLQQILDQKNNAVLRKAFHDHWNH